MAEKKVQSLTKRDPSLSREETFARSPFKVAYDVIGDGFLLMPKASREFVMDLVMSGDLTATEIKESSKNLLPYDPTKGKSVDTFLDNSSQIDIDTLYMDMLEKRGFDQPVREMSNKEFYKTFFGYDYEKEFIQPTELDKAMGFVEPKETDNLPVGPTKASQYNFYKGRRRAADGGRIGMNVGGVASNNTTDPFFTQQVDYTPEDYSGVVDYYGGALDSDISVQVIDENDDDDTDNEDTTVLNVLDPVSSDEQRPKQATQYSFGSGAKTPKYDTKVYGSSSVNPNFNTGSSAGDKSDNFVKKGLRDKFGINITADYATESALSPLNIIGPLAPTIVGGIFGGPQEAPFATEEMGNVQYAPMGGLGRFSLDIANSFHVKNAAAIQNSLLDGGGTAGALMSINGMRISRAPGSFRYTGNTMGLDLNQLKALEGGNYGFIGGFTEEFDEATGTYKRTGTKGLMSEVGNDGGQSAMAAGGDYNYETGSFTDSLGNTFAGGMKSHAVAAIAAINKANNSNLSWTEIAATRKQVQTDIFGNLKENSASFIELLTEKAKANAALNSTAQIAVNMPLSADELTEKVTTTTETSQDGTRPSGSLLTPTKEGDFLQNQLANQQQQKEQERQRFQQEREDREAERQERARQAQERAEARAAAERAAERQRQAEIARENQRKADAAQKQGSGFGDPGGDFDKGGGGSPFGGGGGKGGGSMSGNPFAAMGGRIGLQEGGVAAAPAGFVERPPSQVSKAATVADDKPMSVQEGTFVINAAAVEFAGEADIADMLRKAYVKAGKKDLGGPSGQEIDIAVSRGEVIVPAHIARIIGYDRLEKINNRGKPEVERRQKSAEKGFAGRKGYSEGDVVDAPSSGLEKVLELGKAYPRKFTGRSNAEAVEKARVAAVKFFKQLDPVDALTLTMMGEAEVLGNKGMEAVGHVIMNRVNSTYNEYARQNDVYDVITKRFKGKAPQFNAIDYKELRKVVKELQEPKKAAKYRKVRGVAEEVFAGVREDFTGGALLFWNPKQSTNMHIQKGLRDGIYEVSMTQYKPGPKGRKQKKSNIMHQLIRPVPEQLAKNSSVPMDEFGSLYEGQGMDVSFAKQQDVQKFPNRPPDRVTSFVAQQSKPMPKKKVSNSAEAGFLDESSIAADYMGSRYP